MHVRSSGASRRGARSVGDAGMLRPQRERYGAPESRTMCCRPPPSGQATNGWRRSARIGHGPLAPRRAPPARARGRVERRDVADDLVAVEDRAHPLPPRGPIEPLEQERARPAPVHARLGGPAGRAGVADGLADYFGGQRAVAQVEIVADLAMAACIRRGRWGSGAGWRCCGTRVLHEHRVPILSCCVSYLAARRDSPEPEVLRKDRRGCAPASRRPLVATV